MPVMTPAAIRTRLSPVPPFVADEPRGQAHHHGRADADEDVGPEAGRLLAGFPFQADESAEGYGQDELEQDVDEFHRLSPFRQSRPALPRTNAAT